MQSDFPAVSDAVPRVRLHYPDEGEESLQTLSRHSSRFSLGRLHGHRHWSGLEQAYDTVEAEAGQDSSPASRRHHLHHGFGGIKYAWALFAGFFTFLAVYFLAYPAGQVFRAERHIWQLLIWPSLILVLSGLVSLAVVYGLRLGSDPITRATALRHYVGRKLARLGLMSVLFHAGWLVGLFLTLAVTI